MGQELLEDKQWSDGRDPSTLVNWDGFDAGDHTVTAFARFVSDLIALRWRYPQLRRGRASTLHVHDLNRVLAFHRSIEDGPADVVVVVSLNDNSLYQYRLPLPSAGTWAEVFNSDLYDHFPNPMVTGNGGHVIAGNDGFASITIPANGVIVLTRE
jgi:1,4-alpha-glucan branching enzyme